MIVVLSPHTDDAIFSIGAHLTTLDDVTIASVFAGIPDDPAGHQKHTTLRAEHDKACRIIGATPVNGDFLDDVYPPPALADVRAWINQATANADLVYIPLGIHHPDHITVTATALHTPHIAAKARFYEELPYRTDYPHLAATRRTQLTKTLGTIRPVHAVGDHTQKLAAIRAYKSQTDQQVINRIMVNEHIWQPA